MGHFEGHMAYLVVFRPRFSPNLAGGCIFVRGGNLILSANPAGHSGWHGRLIMALEFGMVRKHPRRTVTACKWLQTLTRRVCPAFIKVF